MYDASKPALALAIVLVVIAVALLFVGCASYRIPTPCGDATLKTFCKTVELPKVTYTVSNCTITVEGLVSKGDKELITASAGAIGAIAGQAAKAMAK
jgi:hypothetical protein